MPPPSDDISVGTLSKLEDLNAKLDSDEEFLKLVKILGLKGGKSTP